MPVKSSIPIPIRVMPSARIRPGPSRADRRPAKVEATMIAPVMGRKLSPASIGVKPSTCWR